MGRTGRGRVDSLVGSGVGGWARGGGAATVFLVSMLYLQPEVIKFERCCAADPTETPTVCRVHVVAKFALHINPTVHALSQRSKK